MSVKLKTKGHVSVGGVSLEQDESGHVVVPDELAQHVPTLVESHGAVVVADEPEPEKKGIKKN